MILTEQNLQHVMSLKPGELEIPKTEATRRQVVRSLRGTMDTNRAEFVRIIQSVVLAAPPKDSAILLSEIMCRSIESEFASVLASRILSSLPTHNLKQQDVRSLLDVFEPARIANIKSSSPIAFAAAFMHTAKAVLLLNELARKKREPLTKVESEYRGTMVAQFCSLCVNPDDMLEKSVNPNLQRLIESSDKVLRLLTHVYYRWGGCDILPQHKMKKYAPQVAEILLEDLNNVETRQAYQNNIEDWKVGDHVNHVWKAAEFRDIIKTVGNILLGIASEDWGAFRRILDKSNLAAQITANVQITAKFLNNIAESSWKDAYTLAVMRVGGTLQIDCLSDDTRLLKLDVTPEKLANALKGSINLENYNLDYNLSDDICVVPTIFQKGGDFLKRIGYDQQEIAQFRTNLHKKIQETAGRHEEKSLKVLLMSVIDNHGVVHVERLEASALATTLAYTLEYNHNLENEVHETLKKLCKDPEGERVVLDAIRLAIREHHMPSKIMGMMGDTLLEVIVEKVTSNKPIRFDEIKSLLIAFPTNKSADLRGLLGELDWKSLSNKQKQKYIVAMRLAVADAQWDDKKLKLSPQLDVKTTNKLSTVFEPFRSVMGEIASNPTLCQIFPLVMAHDVQIGKATIRNISAPEKLGVASPTYKLNWWPGMFRSTITTFKKFLELVDKKGYPDVQNVLQRTPQKNKVKAVNQGEFAITKRANQKQMENISRIVDFAL